MNTRATLKYSIYASLKNLSPFYITLCGLVLLFLCVQSMSESGTLGSWDVLAGFVACGVATCFKERFHFFLQNGYSRKTLYVNFIITFFVIAICMSIFEYLIVFMNNQGWISYQSFFSSLYEQEALRSAFENILWHSSLFLAFMSISLCFTIIFYRMTKWMRIVCFLILPTVLIVGFPLLGVLLPNLNLFEKFFEFTLHFLGLFNEINPFVAVLSFSIVAVISLIASYVVIRNVNLQKA